MPPEPQGKKTKKNLAVKTAVSPGAEISELTAKTSRPPSYFRTTTRSGVSKAPKRDRKSASSVRAVGILRSLTAASVSASEGDTISGQKSVSFSPEVVFRRNSEGEIRSDYDQYREAYQASMHDDSEEEPEDEVINANQEHRRSPWPDLSPSEPYCLPTILPQEQPTMPNPSYAESSPCAGQVYPGTAVRSDRSQSPSLPNPEDDAPPTTWTKPHPWFQPADERQLPKGWE